MDTGVLRAAGRLLTGGDPAGDRDKKVLGVVTGDVLADEAGEGAGEEGVVGDADGADEEEAGEVVSASAACERECAASGWRAVPARAKPAAADAATSAPVINASISGRRKRRRGRRPAPGRGCPVAGPGAGGGFAAVTV